MARSVKEIAAAIGVPAENMHPVDKGLHMEIIDVNTMRVWQTMDNVTVAQYEALTLEDPYSKAGIGPLAGYTSFFRQSPDAQEVGPMETIVVDGHRFSHCANPIGDAQLPAGPDGPRHMKINKHHSIVYEAGTELPCLTLATGETFVHVVGGEHKTEELHTPDGWSFDTVRLKEETVVELPCPTNVLFFATPQGLQSYQGPVPRPT